MPSGPFDGLDVMPAAPIPPLAALGAALRAEAGRQARHRTGGSMVRDQLVATVGSFPLALATTDQDCVTWLVGEAIERALGHQIADAPLSDARARIGEYVGPPFLGHRLLRMRPRAALDRRTRFQHGGHQPSDVGKAPIEDDEVRRRRHDPSTLGGDSRPDLATCGTFNAHQHASFATSRQTGKTRRATKNATIG